ncbi:hypothetical protein MSG28_011173 [Choristoneura fumiferana]|uniref:Uncharacterized protein n=1 Tax=Choristoneura fumiferana TaxID=7141 RepID=A0ACC0KQW9_CHOFU|nr:hypothetical protein MSG28_011173 [Choristoneura fumiferana]
MCRCEECGRRFFWVSGLRAHGRAHWSRLARAPLACGWPGCGRAFRQPCRLREHARAHTGDKPYPCRYPNCGWSFRTASKLVRHARRHTGERRHACACGRAFLRREHLREHQARHAPQPRPRHHCAHDGCTQSFNNMSSLYIHMKKVHKKEEEKVAPKAEVTEVSTIALTDLENNMFMVSFLPESGEPAAESPAAPASPEREWHAARTHCTWPLAPRAPAYDDAFVLEDAHVEQSESSESNIYTVRSDLFLHGNLLHNEDSQQMGSAGALAGAAGGAPPASPPHADLPLLDTHSTIDLMQEELMYTDAAVDESSFQVLLLSGDELG